MNDRDGQVRATFAVAVTLVAVSGLLVSQQSPATFSEDRRQPDWSEGLYQDLDRAASMYNDRVGDLYRMQVWGVDLGAVKGLVSGVWANVYVLNGDGPPATYSLRIGEGNRVVELTQGTRDDATVRVFVDKGTVERISGEYTQVRAMKESFLRDAIHVEGLGPINGIKWAVAVGVVRWVVSSSDSSLASLTR